MPVQVYSDAFWALLQPLAYKGTERPTNEPCGVSLRFKRAHATNNLKCRIRVIDPWDLLFFTSSSGSFLLHAIPTQDPWQTGSKCLK